MSTPKNQIIQLRFTHDGKPSGREYAYYAAEEIQVGDTVIIEGTKKGVVTAVNVSEEVIESFKDKVKTIVGKYEKEEELNG